MTIFTTTKIDNMTFEETYKAIPAQEVEPKESRLKINTLEVAGLASVLKALRLPFGLSNRSYVELDIAQDNNKIATKAFCEVNENDLRLMSALVRRGDEHSKAIRGLVVYAEISAPIWFYRELETYRFGRERLSCESTMHIDCKGIGGEELQRVKDNIPMGHIQRTVDMFSYQTLRRIYQQRKGHRLQLWAEFLEWIETLPFAEELILTGLKDGAENKGV